MTELIRSNLPRAYAGAPTSSVMADAGDRAEPVRARVADVDTTATTGHSTRSAELTTMRPAVAPAPGGSATTPTTLKWTNGAAPVPATARAYASAAPEADFPAPLPPSSGPVVSRW